MSLKYTTDDQSCFENPKIYQNVISHEIQESFLQYKNHAKSIVAFSKYHYFKVFISSFLILGFFLFSMQLECYCFKG